ncbi:hypothetical protein [Leptothoe sp. PORK10 BA2]|uniref:hypothetical protein n=1 Tax=Leptothoe sp. PORK10 BA2 TaxID=3110254 RepID=UPI002B21CA5D|nr:hypothetical protein [Leptothoe sp. PORK10 BA2]MEA5466613.1 hypothetical protein [Leptothoe sp. PORK10 BA2]
MILSRICTEGRATRINPCWAWVKPFNLSVYLGILLLPGVSACGPKRPVIPDDVEAIARRCYETLVTSGRTPKLDPSQSMEDGTFLIGWSMAEFPDERGSCKVDGRGAVLLLTSNEEEQSPTEGKPPPEQ